jgi:hypothetical protein
MSEIIEIQSEAKIPEDLKPSTAMEPVQIDAVAVGARRRLNQAEIDQVRQQLGVVQWNPAVTRALGAVGFDAEAIGISRIVNGGLIVAQTATLEALAEAQTQLKKARGQAGKRIWINVINQLSKTLNQMNISSSMATMAKTDADNSKVFRASPAKGAAMGPAVAVITSEAKTS